MDTRHKTDLNADEINGPDKSEEKSTFKLSQSVIDALEAADEVFGEGEWPPDTIKQTK